MNNHFFLRAAVEFQSHRREIASFFQYKKMCLTCQHVAILECLQTYGLLSQQELADKLSKDKSTITRLIIPLLDYEFVSVIRDVTDKRKNMIKLIPTGEILLASLYEWVTIKQYNTMLPATLSEERIP